MGRRNKNLQEFLPPVSQIVLNLWPSFQDQNEPQWHAYVTTDSPVCRIVLVGSNELIFNQLEGVWLGSSERQEGERREVTCHDGPCRESGVTGSARHRQHSTAEQHSTHH